MGWRWARLILSRLDLILVIFENKLNPDERCGRVKPESIGRAFRQSQVHPPQVDPCPYSYIFFAFKRFKRSFYAPAKTPPPDQTDPEREEEFKTVRGSAQRKDTINSAKISMKCVFVIILITGIM